jgi:hypothetical protein
MGKSDLTPGSHQVSPLICLFDPEVLSEFFDAARKNLQVLQLFYYGSSLKSLHK